MEPNRKVNYSRQLTEKLQELLHSRQNFMSSNTKHSNTNSSSSNFEDNASHNTVSMSTHERHTSSYNKNSFNIERTCNINEVNSEYNYNKTNPSPTLLESDASETLLPCQSKEDKDYSIEDVNNTEDQECNQNPDVQVSNNVKSHIMCIYHYIDIHY